MNTIGPDPQVSWYQCFDTSLTTQLGQSVGLEMESWEGDVLISEGSCPRKMKRRDTGSLMRGVHISHDQANSLRGHNHERLHRMTKQWRSLAAIKNDTVYLGDANLCAKKWNDDNNNLKDHAETVQTFLVETSSTQLVK